MRNRLIALFAAASMLASPALAQKPDAMCAGIDSVLKAATGAGGLAALGKGWKTGAVSAATDRPTGMEGAYDCSVTKSQSAGGRDEFDCIWMLNGASPAVTSITDRVRSCLAPRGWVSDPLSEDRGAKIQRFTLKSSMADVVAIEAGPAKQHTSRLSISAPTK